MVKTRIALAVWCALVAACSRPASPTMPTPVSAAPASAAEPSFAAVAGAVLDTAMRPLAGARVEAVDGPSAGASSVASAEGLIQLRGTFSLSSHFRASIDGHEPLTLQLTCSVPDCSGGAQPWVLFYLRPFTPPVDLAGDFVMTMTAGASCMTLPAEARTRSYRVTLTPRMREGTSDQIGYFATLDASSVLESMRRFPIGVAGNNISINLSSGHGEIPALVEGFGDSRYVTFAGYTRTTVTGARPDRIAMAFQGWVGSIALRQPLTTDFVFARSDVIAQEQCEAADHQMALHRR